MIFLGGVVPGVRVVGFRRAGGPIQARGHRVERSFGTLFGVGRPGPHLRFRENFLLKSPGLFKLSLRAVPEIAPEFFRTSWKKWWSDVAGTLRSSLDASVAFHVGRRVRRCGRSTRSADRSIDQTHRAVLSCGGLGFKIYTWKSRPKQKNQSG